MVEQILSDFQRDVSEVTLIPSSGGVFEVTADTVLLYSKEATGRHAEYEEVATQIRSALAG